MYRRTLVGNLAAIWIALVPAGARGDGGMPVLAGNLLAYEPRFSTIDQEFGHASWAAMPGFDPADRTGLRPPDCTQLVQLVDDPDRLLAASEHPSASWRLLPCALHALKGLARPASSVVIPRDRPMEDLWRRLDLTSLHTSFRSMVALQPTTITLARAVYLRMALSDRPDAVSATLTPYRSEIRSPGEWVTSFEAVAAADWDDDGREDLLVLSHDRQLSGTPPHGPEPYFQIRFHIATATNADSRILAMDYIDWLIARRTAVKSVLLR